MIMRQEINTQIESRVNKQTRLKCSNKHGPLGPGHSSVEFTLAAETNNPSSSVSRHDTHPKINESAATPDHILRTTGPAFNSTIIAQVR